MTKVNVSKRTNEFELRISREKINKNVLFELRPLTMRTFTDKLFVID